LEDFVLRFSNAEARVQRFEQRLAYGGLLEGLPTRERNDELIERLRNGSHTYVVPPLQTPIDFFGRPYPLGTPASLPRIESIAHLSAPAWTTPEFDVSFGRVVWFQDNWGPDLDPITAEHLAGVDWTSFAVEDVW
jgi:hypothetical protein